MINEVLKEFEETFSGVDDDGTYKECIAKDVKDWLKEKLTTLEKKTKEEFLKRILPEEMSTKTINHITWNDNFVKGFNCCIKEITNNYNKSI